MTSGSMQYMSQCREHIKFGVLPGRHGGWGAYLDGR